MGAKKTKKEKRSRDNEAAGEKANKGFRKSERHLERAEKKSKLQNGAKETAKAAKQAAETSKAAVQNARKKESTSKSAYMAAVAEERKSKAGSDAQMESLNKIKEKAFAAQKRDLAKAAKAQKDADEKASKTRVESWIPTELAAEVKNVKQKLDTENALLKDYWKQLTAVKLSKATATSKAQKAEVAASIKKAQKKVAIGNKEQAQEKYKQKVRDYNDTYKKNQAHVQAAKSKVTEWK